MAEIAKNQRFRNLDTLFYFLTICIFFPIFKIYHRAERVGLKNAPRKGPYIVIANHASFLDPWYLGVMFRPLQIRYLITNKWYLKNKFSTLFFDLCGCVPVTPDDVEPSTVKAILKILRNGGVVGIFPEGRVCNNGKLQKFNTGAVSIAMRAKVPIIPVTICGSYEILPRNKLIPRPTKLKIVIGKPINFSNYDKEKKNSKDIYINEMQKIKDWIVDQLDQFQNR